MHIQFVYLSARWVFSRFEMVLSGSYQTGLEGDGRNMEFRRYAADAVEICHRKSRHFSV